MTRTTRPAPVIRILGARTHNLKNISVSIPLARLTVVTGVSGSGKSSLAFDTLYAEGQRRYAESLSTYARQFLERLDRPDVDSIEPVPPAIALEQKNGVRNARSTVGTQTEIYDSLRLLFAHGGTTFCPECEVAGVPGGVDRAVEELASSEDGSRVVLAAPVDWKANGGPQKDRGRRKREREEGLRVAELKRAGFFRALAPSGEAVEIPDEPGAIAPLLDPEGRLSVVVGRFVVSEDSRPEIAAAVEAAFSMAGCLVVRTERGSRTFRRGLHCPSCGRDFRDPTPPLFAFNSPLGACAACQGFGRIIGVDLEKVIPDADLRLDERPVAAWNTPAYESAYDDLFRACRRYSVRTDVPIARLSAHEREVLIKGRGEFYGINGFFEWLETKRYKIHVRVLLARYRAYRLCPDCNGARLGAASMWVRFRGRTIAELAELSLRDLKKWFDELSLSPEEEERLGSVVAEIRSRVRYMNDVGLEYLTLSRAARTLSGGESQRIGLASALGGSLTGTLYVLDEPTIGLHAVDTRRLLAILRRLADRGNTVVVVEHDPEAIEAADHVIDLGPGAGSRGGELLFEGTPRALARVKSSATGALLRRRGLPGRGGAGAPDTRIGPPREGRGGRVVAFRRAEGAVTVVGAREHNLANLTVRFPLGRLVSVSGVSGSGKSTLVRDVLHNAYARRFKGTVQLDVGRHDRIEGLDLVSDILLVDQSPLGRSARSNPVTYTKAWDEIRQVFARNARAVSRRITARDFSFNSAGGRCEICKGTGWQTIDMQFLADVTVRCDGCDGRRFQGRVLAVRHRGKNIGDVLALTVDEAMQFFSDEPAIVRRLTPLHEAGLGYLPLGQPTATLSGGEAQRLKLASFLEIRPATSRGVLFLFDEPTTGLHASDVDRLLGTFRRLISRGHSVIAVEHHLEFLATSDWIIDLGPGGGDEGGRIVAEGTPDEIRRSPASLTGRFLAEGKTSPPPEERSERSRAPRSS
ncbi:MAG TPA: excinuclease ABC subunit UvrA [Thermoanaerobaculia bacterium]|nr:excinuclease ABC subunit UvrA [Thermoanaerobaculia bacterium]